MSAGLLKHSSFYEMSATARRLFVRSKAFRRTKLDVIRRLRPPTRCNGVQLNSNRAPRCASGSPGGLIRSSPDAQSCSAFCETAQQTIAKPSLLLVSFP